MTSLTRTARQALNACGFDEPLTRLDVLKILYGSFVAGLVLVAASTAGLPELMAP